MERTVEEPSCNAIRHGRRSGRLHPRVRGTSASDIHPSEIIRHCWTATASDRRETRSLIGRRHLAARSDALAGILDECIEESAARVAVVTAAAGMGKSRLGAEFIRRAGSITPGRGLGWPRPLLRTGSTLDLLAQTLRGALGILETLRVWGKVIRDTEIDRPYEIRNVLLRRDMVDRGDYAPGPTILSAHHTRPYRATDFSDAAYHAPAARGEDIGPDHPSQRNNPPPLHSDSERPSRRAIGN